MPNLVVPSPGSYRGDALTQEAFHSLSRNFALDRDLPVGRRGYTIRRSKASASLAYLERFPCDEGNGTLRAAFILDAAVWEDKTTPTLIETLAVTPYAGTGVPLPGWAFAYGRTVLVNGTDYRVYIFDAGAIQSRIPLTDPGIPTLGAVAGGSLTQGVSWYVRIRWYDQITGTFSGPSQRLTPASFIILGGANQSILVSRPSIPSRASHWQVQLVKTTDTPSGYEISFDVGTAGLITAATTDVTVTIAPASGTRFEFRTDDAQTLYRHANPPPAHYVVFWKGRWFYAASNGRWLVWSDVGNPEHFFHDTADPTQGFNTALGDGVGNSIAGPCTGLFCNQLALYYATHGEINICEGTWQEVFDDTGVFIGRRARISPLTQNGMGAVSPSFIVRDQEIYFHSVRGPAVISGGRVEPLDPTAVRNIWVARDRAHMNRFKVGYDPDSDTVLFSVVTQQTPVAGGPDLILPWQTSKRVWCPPWTLQTSGMSLTRWPDRGLRLFLGSWHGQQLEFGVGEGDGWDGSDPDAAGRSPSSVTSTTATFSGETWATDVHQGKSVILVDPNGNWYPRQVSTNSGTVLSWLGAVTGLATTWTTYLGGIPYVWHFAEIESEEMNVTKVAIPLDDQPSRRAS